MGDLNENEDFVGVGGEKTRAGTIGGDAPNVEIPRAAEVANNKVYPPMKTKGIVKTK